MIDRLGSEVNSLDPVESPSEEEEKKARPRSFWRMRAIEAGMILSMALYYVACNPNIRIHAVHLPAQNLNPLYSLPFLLIFALLCWYRFPVAIALLPLSLPFCYVQKDVTPNLRFSLVEITLYTCVTVGVLQYLVYLLRGRRWPYLLSWSALRDRYGPFLLPIGIFFLAALVSVAIAYSQRNAARAFREEVFGPLLYVVLIFWCLRTRQDLLRLLLALFGSGLIVALIGCVQYFFFRSTIVPDVDGLRRVTAVYSSGNGIGTFFDYMLPLGLAIICSRLSWKWRLSILICCLPFLFVLYESGSRGAILLAIPTALVFIVAFAIRNRSILLIASVSLVVMAAIVGSLYSQKIINAVLDGHTSSSGQSTILERPWLWLTALDMIHDSPWLGYGMDNWLCHYSNSYYNVCLYPNGFPGGKWVPGSPPHPPLHAYWITRTPSGQPTGLGNEPTLSHPHNVFLQVWVSIGIFGLLAFLAILVLFYWTFARLLRYLQKVGPPDYELQRTLLIGVGAGMLAALVQGLGDSSFLEQNLAFCFWILVAALLLIRFRLGMPWRSLPPHKSGGEEEKEQHEQKVEMLQK
ncbi:MAG TPA: O-antigen ligase family protein [Ktedonobacteraceae bacterium]|nr:O-antigen ligase family protein [Ktedonobacteraceae bacterium]